MIVESLEIEGFRGLAEASLGKFAGINILVGKAGCGKSSILEALYISLALEKGLKYVIRRRGWFGIDTVKMLFFNKYEGYKKIRIKIELQGGQSECVYIEPIEVYVPYKLTLVLSAKGPITRESLLKVYSTGETRTYVIRGWGWRGLVENTEFVDWNSVYLRDILRKVHRYKEKTYDKEKKEIIKKEIIEVLRSIFKDVEDIRLVEPRYAVRKYVVDLFFKDGKVLSHYALSDGIRYTLIQVIVMLTYRNSVILVEEPELHVHPRLLHTIVNAILNSYKKRGNQIFITTHSLELVEIILEKARELEFRDEELKVYNLRLIDGTLYCREYTLNEAYEALKEAERDLRV